VCTQEYDILYRMCTFLCTHVYSYICSYLHIRHRISYSYVHTHSHSVTVFLCTHTLTLSHMCTVSCNMLQRTCTYVYSDVHSYVPIRYRTICCNVRIRHSIYVSECVCVHRNTISCIVCVDKNIYKNIHVYIRMYTFDAGYRILVYTHTHTHTHTHSHIYCILRYAATYMYNKILPTVYCAC